MQQIQDLKELININDIDAFKSYVNTIIIPMEKSIDIAYIFQKVYIHACLKGRKEIETYLREQCFHLLPQIEQISIRQVFAYGRYLLKRAV